MTTWMHWCGTGLLALLLLGCGAESESSDPEDVAQQQFGVWSCPTTNSSWVCEMNLDDKLKISGGSNTETCDASGYCAGWCTGTSCAGGPNPSYNPALVQQTTVRYNTSGTAPKVAIQSSSTASYASTLEWIKVPLTTRTATDHWWRGYWRFYIPVVSTTDPSLNYKMNTLEFDLFSGNNDGAHTAAWSSHCDFDPGTTDGTCHWKIDAQDGGTLNLCPTWMDPISGGITSHLKAGQWHSVEWQVQKNYGTQASDYWVSFNVLTVDGTAYSVNKKCGYRNVGWSKSWLQVQQDQNSYGNGFTEYVDDMALFHDP